MRIKDAVKTSGLPRAEIEVLLSAIVEQPRTWIVAHGDDTLTQNQEQQLHAWMERRRGGEPVAYITGTKEFYGRMFHVDPRVLIPRPSTEALVDLALDFLKKGNDEVRAIDSEIVGIAKSFGSLQEAKIIVDIGTGSGCIAITLASELPDYRIIATDMSEDALAVARQNAKDLGVGDRIEFRKGNALDPIRDLPDPFIIVSNPPYIPEGRSIMNDVAAFEPSSALFAGPDGTDVLKKILDVPGACRGVVLECERGQLGLSS